MTILSSTYLYRVLKTSWGVHITLRAEVRGGAPQRDAKKVVDGLFVLDATKLFELSPEQMSMLGKGLELVAPEVIAAVPEPPVTVEVQAVEHNFIDYQDEGLAAAVLGWAIGEFGLPPREIPVSYDRSVRRYVFDFDAVHPAG